MKNRVLILLERQLQPWLKLGLITIELLSQPATNKTKVELNATLAKINLLPIMESFYEFLDDLPLWFY